MRVCMVYVGGLTPTKGGGVASVISNIVKHTADKIDYSLLTTYDETERGEIQEIYPSNVQIKYVRPANNFLVNAMRYLIKDAGDVDILHFHDFPFFGRDLGLAMKAHLKKQKLIYTHHIGLEEVVRNELMLGEIGELMLGYYHLALNRFGKIMKKVVVPSQYAVDHDLARFGALRDRICVIGNGVDVDRIRRVKPIRLEGEPSILFVGHLLWRKGIDLLLEAFYKFSLQQVKANPKLYIIGSGPMEKWCKEYMVQHELGGSVHFCGCPSEPLKFRIMKGSDIVIVPSRYETASITLLEAMAAGRPVVATRVGGIPEYFGRGVNGILVRPSSDDITRAIRFLSENENLALEFGRNNERAATLFDWRNITQSYVSLYNSIRGC